MFQTPPLTPGLPTFGIQDPVSGQQDQALQGTKTAIESVARAAKLHPAGVEALSRWTCWLAYAAQQAKDPQQLAWSDWRAVLPVDNDNAVDNLTRVLRRAGEPPRVAREAADLAYQHETLFVLNTHSPERCAALLSADTTPLLDEAAMFYNLPTWAREMALFATNLTGKDMASIPDLRDMDLSWLRAYFADFGGCDISGSKFQYADLRGASLKHARKEGTLFQYAMQGSAPSLKERSCPRPVPATIQVPEHWENIGVHGPVKFLEDKEILHVFPFVRVAQIDGIEVGYLEGGRAVIQQYHLRGGTTAVEAMLIADYGKSMDTVTAALRTEDGGNNETLRYHIQLAGLQEVTTDISSLEMLAETIARGGPAKVNLADKELGHPPVIIDHMNLSKSLVQMRDPFHGWAIVAELTTLIERLHFPTVVIQVKRLADTAGANTSRSVSL